MLNEKCTDKIVKGRNASTKMLNEKCIDNIVYGQKCLHQKSVSFENRFLSSVRVDRDACTIFHQLDDIMEH